MSASEAMKSPEIIETAGPTGNSNYYDVVVLVAAQGPCMTTAQISLYQYKHMYTHIVVFKQLAVKKSDRREHSVEKKRSSKRCKSALA